MTREQYQEYVRYWSALSESILHEVAAQDWRPWLNTAYENYASGDDEIVVFSLWSPSQGRGFSVQQPVGENERNRSLKLLTRIAVAESESPIEHLVIVAQPGAPTEKLLLEMLRLWMLRRIHSIEAEVT